MKDIFKILQEEKDRILGMHESATKNQYLGIISEQAFVVPSYTTKKWNQFSDENESSLKVWVGIQPGVKFEATKDSGIITAKNVQTYTNTTNGWVRSTQGPRYVSFYCKRGKFYFQGDKTGWVSAQLSSALVNNLCGKLNYQTKIATPGTKFTQSKDSSFTTENGGIADGPRKGTTWTWDGKQATAPGANGGTVIFKCYPSKPGFNFQFENFLYKDNGLLKGALFKQFCRVADNTQKPPAEVAPPPKTETPPPHTELSQQRNSQLMDLNKQIQQLLGNQTPTGKLTDDDINNIMIKLG